MRKLRDVTYKKVYICTHNELVETYQKMGSVWKVGEFYGIPGQWVHEILSRTGSNQKMNVFSDTEKQILLEKYNDYRELGKLEELAKQLGRTKQFICRQAKYLGLTNNGEGLTRKYISEGVSKRTKEFYRTNPHPKGMLNKKHSLKTKEAISANSKAMWHDPNNKLNSNEHRQNLSDRMAKWRNENPDKASNYSRVKRGSVTIGGKTFFARSSWEANIAAYFEFLKSHNEIRDWEHEPETFWFEKIKRGVRSYLPDFKIIRLDSTFYFVEVKGWMDKKSITKIKRMALYYPKIELQIIDQNRYKAIKKSSSVIPDWGLIDSNECLPKIKKCELSGCEGKHVAKGYCGKHYQQIFKTVPTG